MYEVQASRDEKRRHLMKNVWGSKVLSPGDDHY
jgi:hypothetical protein